MVKTRAATRSKSRDSKRRRNSSTPIGSFPEPSRTIRNAEAIFFLLFSFIRTFQSRAARDAQREPQGQLRAGSRILSSRGSDDLFRSCRVSDGRRWYGEVHDVLIKQVHRARRQR